MPSIAREAIQLRNKSIVEDWYENGLSYSDIKEKYGVTATVVQRLLRLDRAVNGERERKERCTQRAKLAGRKPLSDRHAHIGLQVTRHLQKTQQRPTNFGMPLGMSCHTVRAIEQGVFDLTLTQITAIAAAIGLSFTDLVQTRENALAG